MQAPTSAAEVGLRSRDTGRSTYARVRTLLDHLQAQHRRLRATYRDQATALDNGSADERRAALLYSYLARREDAIQAFLDRFEDAERDRLLDSWLQYADTTSLDRVVDATVDEPPREARELRARTAELDRALTTLYAELEASSDAPNVTALFGHLREVVEERAKEHAEHLPQAEDL